MHCRISRCVNFRRLLVLVGQRRQRTAISRDTAGRTPSGWVVQVDMESETLQRQVDEIDVRCVWLIVLSSTVADDPGAFQDQLPMDLPNIPTLGCRHCKVCIQMMVSYPSQCQKLRASGMLGSCWQHHTAHAVLMQCASQDASTSQTFKWAHPPSPSNSHCLCSIPL